MIYLCLTLLSWWIGWYWDSLQAVILNIIWDNRPEAERELMREIRKYGSVYHVPPKVLEAYQRKTNPYTPLWHGPTDLPTIPAPPPPTRPRVPPNRDV